MILGMGVPELLVILIIALIIFGPKNLPKLGSALGKTVKNVREGMEDEEPKQVEAADEPAPAADVAVAAAEDDDDADGKFCTKCGTKNASDAAFCKKCGSELE